MNYNSYASYMKDRYGYRIFRVGVDAGFTCPNRLNSPTGAGCIYCDSQGAKAAYLRSSESRFRHDSGFEESIDTIACSSEACKEFSFTFDYQDIRKQVERGLEFLARRYKANHFALYLQSFSNTFAPYDRLRELYDFATSLHPWEGFIISTRPDCIDDRKLELISSYKPACREVCIELGLQSGSDEILRAMKRGHDVQCLISAAEKVRLRGIGLCLHVLTGFPGEGYRELDQTIEVINRVHPDALKIHNLNVAAGTELYERFLEGEVTVPCMTRHIENVSYILRRIYPDIVIERLMCETPNHRLASPRLFPDKNRFLRNLDAFMEERGYRQGDLCQRQ